MRWLHRLGDWLSREMDAAHLGELPEDQEDDLQEWRRRLAQAMQDVEKKLGEKPQLYVCLAHQFAAQHPGAQVAKCTCRP